MATLEPTAALGTPVPPDIETIESELTGLWKLASGGEGDRGVIRACSCNLVILAGELAAAASLPPILLEVSRWHPSRILVAFRDPEGGVGPRKPFRAWISAQCAVPFAGAPEVCCEAISVGAREDAVVDLPNTLVSLMVPDLPVFLYARAFRPSERKLVERIARFTDLIIVDSHAFKNDPEPRERLLELLTDPPGAVPMRDLNWSRVTPWREMIAEFFDAPSDRRYLEEISELEISRSVAAPGNIPTRTLLLTGWLASRLGWKRLATERAKDQWISRWSSRAGELIVRFTGTPSATIESSGISSLELRTRSGAIFAVAHDRSARRMTATATVGGRSIVHSVPEEPADEATLLIHELSLTGEDASFKAALGEALALERSFRS